MVAVMQKSKISEITVSKGTMAPDEYLVFERASEEKHEYIDGEIILMAGASRRHNIISVKTSRLLDQQLDETDYEVYAGDMRVKIEATGRYVYPDVIVVEDSPALEDSQFDTLLNPKVIIEILSPSTEAYDRGDKFAQYRTVDSLTDYLLITQGKPHIEHYIRQPDNTWVLTDYRSLDDIVSIASIDCKLALADVYKKVKFDESAVHLNGHASTA